MRWSCWPIRATRSRPSASVPEPGSPSHTAICPLAGPISPAPSAPVGAPASRRSCPPPCGPGWPTRPGGAEALAFDVAVLGGAEAALPHGSPGDRPIVEGQVLLFDFGAQVAGYRSDMTRTLFVGKPSAR